MAAAGIPRRIAGVGTEPDPAPAGAFEQADRLGLLLYADKQALGAGRVAEVAGRVAARARRQRLLLLGTQVLMLAQGLFALTSSDDRRHGLLGTIAGCALLAMLLFFALFVLPKVWRTYARIEREAASVARLSGSAPLR
jgi:hypothetical protein